jgi:pimeloyl-ACP methyl ester carboxylesterase
LRTWHEITGDGPAVVLLHGAFGGAMSWYFQTPALAKAGYRVHAPERRGHAHTPDVAGPLTYSVMADDTIAYLEAQVECPANLIGWSDGAVVGLLVAMRRPELVDRLVLIGQYFNSTGKVHGGLLDQLLGPTGEGPGADIMDYLRTEYDEVSPDGAGHFPVIYAKTLQMIRTEPEIDLATLAVVRAPTLVLQGDRDEVTVKHSADVVAVLPDARLAVLPGSHTLPVENPDPVNALLISFLQGAPRPLNLG